MLDASFLLPLLTAFGLGSVVTAMIQSWLHRRERLERQKFEERKLAYVGLLDAYLKAAVQGTEEAAKEFAYWQVRCELVSPPTVRRAISKMKETESGTETRDQAFDELKAALRSDLRITGS